MKLYFSEFLLCEMEKVGRRAVLKEKQPRADTRAALSFPFAASPGLCLLVRVRITACRWEKEVKVSGEITEVH